MTSEMSEGIRAYHVEIESHGCATCGHDKIWIVVGPDDIALSVSYADEENAKWMAAQMNEAFNLGKSKRGKIPIRVELIRWGDGPWTLVTPGMIYKGDNQQRAVATIYADLPQEGA